MIRLVARELPQKEWTDIASGFRDLSLMQTWEYAKAKAQTGPWQVDRAIFVDGECVVGAVQALVRPLPVFRGGVVWINRGPLWRRSESGDPSLLGAMMEELRRYWVNQQHMYLRVAPPVREDGWDMHPLSVIGYQPGGGAGWASALVDLSRPVELLRGGLQQKWRNCLNKAERQGLTVEFSSDNSVFEEFVTEYKQMLLDLKYQTSVTPAMLSRLQTLLPPERNPFVFAARQKGQPLGTILIARYGETCEYLAGNISDKGREANAGQLLLWCAACEMKAQGYRWFDLGGMDPQRTPPGIFHFKAGFGGTQYRLMEELEAHDGGWRSQVIRWRVRRARQGVGT